MCVCLFLGLFFFGRGWGVGLNLTWDAIFGGGAVFAFILRLVRALIPLTLSVGCSQEQQSCCTRAETLPGPTKREWTAPPSREILSKLVKRMTPGGNKDGMHINEYLHKCLHHKIHPGKQHCKGAHTKRNIHISAFPHAATPPPHWRS